MRLLVRPHPRAKYNQQEFQGLSSMLRTIDNTNRSASVQRIAPANPISYTHTLIK